jgi:hypothetical protein
MRSEQRNGYARLCTPANGSVLAFTALWYASPALYFQKISAQKRRISAVRKASALEISYDRRCPGWERFLF